MDNLSLLQIFKNAVDGLGSQLLSYSLALAAVGTIAMGLVEMLKSVSRARLYFNRWRVYQWVKTPPALGELELLSVGAHEQPHALYDQPVEKMMGQVQAAVNLAMEYPEEYPNLYTFMSEVPEAYWEKGTHDATRDDGKTWREGRDAVYRMRGRTEVGPREKQVMKTAQDATAAKARLHNLVARKLDAMQNQTQYLWERANQYTATAIGVVVFLVAMNISNHPPVGSQEWIVAFLIALPSGVVAPFAKQLAGSLSSFGKG